MIWDIIDVMSEIIWGSLKQFIYPFEILFRPTNIEEQRKKIA